MNSLIYWSWPTMFLYISMGCVPAYCIHKASKVKINKKKIIRIRNTKVTIFSTKFVYYFVSWVYLTFFATARKADSIHGGADSIGYIKDFLNANNLIPSFEKALKIQNYREPGYMIFVKVIHSIIPENPFFYFFIVYGIIAAVFIWFVSVYSSEIEDFAILPLFIYPFILSFNTLRESLAIVCVLIAIVFLNRKQSIKSIIMLFVAGTMHITAWLYLCIPAYYWLINWINGKKKLNHIKRWKFIIMLILFTIGCALSIDIIIPIVMNTHFHHYVNDSVNLSGLFRYLLLSIMIAYFYKDLMKKFPGHGFLFFIAILDLILWPITNALNFWRADEYFSIIRVIVWCDIGRIVGLKFLRERTKVLEVAEFIISMAWFSYRIYRTFNASCLMPYVFAFLS